MPEYQDDVKELVYSKLSSLPALYALCLSEPDKRGEAYRKLDKGFEVLIPQEIMDDLPRNPDKLTDHDFERIRLAVIESSYPNHFFTLLNEHIEDHFPMLVLPPIVREFEKIYAKTL